MALDTTDRIAYAIEEKEAEISRLRLENWQLKGALGYPVPGNIPQGNFKCGLCEARASTNAEFTVITTKDR